MKMNLPECEVCPKSGNTLACMFIDYIYEVYCT